MVTEGGEGPAVPKTVDVKKFLSENKLQRAEKIFTERDVQIEELIDFNKDELNEFAKDIGLDTLQRKRFVKAIIALKPKGEAASALTASKRSNQNPHAR